MLADRQSTEATARLRWCDAVDGTEWESLLRRDPRSTVMQHPDFVDLVAAHHPGWQPRWLEARDEEGRLRAGLPAVVRERWGLRVWASGFAGLYGGPVADDAAHEGLLATAFQRAGGWRTMRRELVWGRVEPPKGVWTGLVRLDTALLPIDPARSFDAFLREVLPKNRRNEANRSDRRGLRVERDTTGEHVEAFFPIYLRQCRRWRTPPVPVALLRAALDRFEETALFVAFDASDRVLGAHLVIEGGEELFAWVGTTERSREVFPSTVLIREEARWCHDRGITGLNLGTSLGLRGVENYKKLLGATSSPRWILRSSRWRRGGRGSAT